MDEARLFHDQLLVVKFFVPSSSHPLIARPRLTTLLEEGLRRKLTLISARWFRQDHPGLGLGAVAATGVSRSPTGGLGDPG